MPDSIPVQHFRTYVNIPYYEGIDDALLGKKDNAPSRLEVFCTDKEDEAIANLMVNQQGQWALSQSAARKYPEEVIQYLSCKLMGIELSEGTEIKYEYIQSGAGDLIMGLRPNLRLYAERVMPAGNIRTCLAFQRDEKPVEIIGVTAPTFSEGYHYLNSVNIKFNVLERTLLGMDFAKIAKQHGYKKDSSGDF